MALFCPNELAFGDLATWLAAAATVGAVWAALRTSNKALQAMEQARIDDLKRAEQARHDQAVSMAVVVHHELYMAAAHIEFLVTRLQNQEARRRRDYTLLVLQDAAPRYGLTVLKHLCDRLDPFDPKSRQLLMKCLANWISMEEAPSADSLADATDEQIQESADSVLTTAERIHKDFQAAFDAITPYVHEVLPDAPSRL